MPDLQPTQVTLRHLRVTAYRCFLPDLTGFTGRIAQDQRSAADQTRRLVLWSHYIICSLQMPTAPIAINYCIQSMMFIYCYNPEFASRPKISRKASCRLFSSLQVFHFMQPVPETCRVSWQGLLIDPLSTEHSQRPLKIKGYFNSPV